MDATERKMRIDELEAEENRLIYEELWKKDKNGQYIHEEGTPEVDAIRKRISAIRDEINKLEPNEEVTAKTTEIIIPARTCFSCTLNNHKKRTYTDANGKRQKLSGSYISCKVQNNGSRIWDKLHCMKWKMTRSRVRRAFMLKMVPVDELKLRETDRYGKDKDAPNVPIRLGKSCFTCKFRQGNVIRRHVHCARHDRSVWEYAYCPLHKPIEDYNVVIQFKKFIDRGSGLDFREVVGWSK